MIYTTTFNFDVSGKAYPSVRWAADHPDAPGDALADALDGALVRQWKRGTQHCVTVRDEYREEVRATLQLALTCPDGDTQTRRAVRRILERLDEAPAGGGAKPKPRPKPKPKAPDPTPKACMRTYLADDPGGVYWEANGEVCVAFAIRVGRWAVRVVLYGGRLRHSGVREDLMWREGEPAVQIYNMDAKAPPQQWPTGCAWTSANFKLGGFMRIRHDRPLNSYAPSWRLKREQAMEAQKRVREIIATADHLPKATKDWMDKGSAA